MTRLARPLAVLAAAVLSVLAVPLAVAVPLAGVAHADGVPYSDPNAVGSITFCDQAGQAVTSGSINDRPFVYRAVGSSAAPKPYDAAGRTATLFGYQPRAQIAPGQWSGELLTASARYSNPANPMTAGTARDSSLGDFISDFPPQVDGLVQLRIFLGVPNQPTYTMKYNAADIRVTGNTWTVVNPGNASCASGKSVSIEDLLPQPSNPPATPTASGKASASAPASTASSSARASAAPAASSPPSVAAAAASSTQATGSSNTGQNVVVLVLVVAAIAGAAWYFLSRQRGSDTS